MVTNINTLIPGYNPITSGKFSPYFWKLGVFQITVNCGHATDSGLSFASEQAKAASLPVIMKPSLYFDTTGNYLLIRELFWGNQCSSHSCCLKIPLNQPSPDSLRVTLNYKFVRARQQSNCFCPPMRAKVGPKFPFVPAALRRANAES